MKYLSPKSLSFWAKGHPQTARWYIAIAHCILIPLALLLGFLLWLNHFEYSPLSHDIFTTLFLLSIIGYPIKGAVQAFWRYSYQRHKALDFTIVLSGFLALASLTSMKLEQTPLYASEAQGLKIALKTPEEAKSTLTYLRENTSWHALKKNARMLKKELREGHKMAKKQGGDTALRVLYTFLVLLLAAGLAYLIAAWSCSLACSGQEGAANILLIGGGALLILLTVISIRAIWRKRKKSDMLKAKDPTLGSNI